MHRVRRYLNTISPHRVDKVCSNEPQETWLQAEMELLEHASQICDHTSGLRGDCSSASPVLGPRLYSAVSLFPPCK